MSGGVRGAVAGHGGRAHRRTSAGRRGAARAGCAPHRRRPDAARSRRGARRGRPTGARLASSGAPVSADPTRRATRRRIRSIRSSTCCFRKRKSTGGRKPPIDPSVFRDKIVVVGTRAAGAYDVHKTAFSASTPGLHLHATLADNILSKQFMTRASASRRSRRGARDGTGRRRARGVPARRRGRSGRRRPRRVAISAWLTQQVGKRHLDGTRRAAVGGRSVALRRRRVAVLRRGRREAAGQAAVRPLRLEGRVRPAARRTRRWRGSAASGAR